MEKVLKLENEEERVSALYDIFNESSRLLSKSTRVEFLTTIRNIEKFLKPGMRILDLGAGTGEYSLYFASKGFEVTAVELVEKHVNEIKSKSTEDMKLTVIQGNALNLSNIEDESYDVVLCFGPLYHLSNMEDRIRCVSEVKRVCKKYGEMLFAFISNDMVIVTETMCYNPNFLKEDAYDHDTFKIHNFPFVFHTVEQCRNLLRNSSLNIKAEVAADGLCELLADKINAMDDYDYNKWLEYHYYCSEKPELLGYSNHLLFVAKK